MVKDPKKDIKSLELRLRLTRIFSQIIVLLLVLILGYLILPYLQLVPLTIPYLNLSMVNIGSIMLLAIVGFLLYRILQNLLSLSSSFSNALRHLAKGLAVERVGLLKRALYDILVLIVIIVIFDLLIPFSSKLPGIGVYISGALPLVALALAVLIFWDLGKVVYNELEELADIIIDKLEEFEERNASQ
jgi:divalent metal cation (Fe/Co/Zn/Cd) transporter